MVEWSGFESHKPKLRRQAQDSEQALNDMLSRIHPVPRQGDALLIIDLQNDFLPGGALAVPDGQSVLGPLQRWLEHFKAEGLPVVMTRDCHPPDHCSFADFGGQWPVHCVRGSVGAAISSALEMPAMAQVVDKPSDRDLETFDGFTGTDLDHRLSELAISRLWVGGLATDYCVRATVLEGLKRGYAVVVLVEAVRAVNLRAGDGLRALREMAAAGAIVLPPEGQSQERQVL